MNARRAGSLGTIAWLTLTSGIATGARHDQTVVEIVSPDAGDLVAQRSLVRVRVTRGAGVPTVLVRPLTRNEWWVQPPVSPPTDDGAYEVLANFGTEREGIGEYFHVVAVLAGDRLREGQVLRSAPASRATSSVVTVRRQSHD